MAVATHKATVGVKGIQLVFISGLIDEVNKDRKMHYKHQFLLLTIEFYYRFVVPSPLSIFFQLFALCKKDIRKNPFGMNCRYELSQTASVNNTDARGCVA